MPPIVDEPDGVNAEVVGVFPCELEEPALGLRFEPAWLCVPAWRCAPSAAGLLPKDLLPPAREPLDAPKRAPDAGCPPAGEREARTPPDRALPG